MTGLTFDRGALVSQVESGLATGKGRVASGEGEDAAGGFEAAMAAAAALNAPAVAPLPVPVPMVGAATEVSETGALSLAEAEAQAVPVPVSVPEASVRRPAVALPFMAWQPLPEARIELPAALPSESVSVSKPAAEAVSVSVSVAAPASQKESATVSIPESAPTPSAPTPPAVPAPTPVLNPAALVAEVTFAAASSEDDGEASAERDRPESNPATPLVNAAPRGLAPRADDGVAPAAARPSRATAEPDATPEAPAAHHARLVVGEGADRIALSISAHDGHVSIRAHAAQPELASAFVAGAAELRDSLRRQGLELGDVSSRGQTTATGEHSGSERPAPDAERRESRPRPPHAAVEEPPRPRNRNVRVV